MHYFDCLYFGCSETTASLEFAHQQTNHDFSVIMPLVFSTVLDMGEKHYGEMIC